MLKRYFHKDYFSSIGLILVAGLILRLFVSPFGTLTLDQNTFIAWANRLSNIGFRAFYNSWSDYLPGYLYVLWFLGKIKIAIPQEILYKLPAIFADLATSFLIYKIVIKLKNKNWALLISAFYAFNPAIFANSTLWGQVDSFTALFSILVLYFIQLNLWVLSAAALSLGTLFKPTVAFAAPIVFIYLLRKKYKISKILLYGLIGGLVFVLGFLPFSKGNLANFILQRVGQTTGQYPYTSVNAFNFWGIFGFWKSDGIGIFSPLFWGYLLALAGFVVFYFKNKAQKKYDFYYLLACIFLTTFLFITRMHERHMLPIFAPLLIAAASSTYLLIPYFLYSLIYVLNLFFAFSSIGGNLPVFFQGTLPQIISFVSTVSIVLVFVGQGKNINFDKLLRKKTFKQKIKFPVLSISKTNLKYLLYFVLAFSLLTRAISLSSPENEYFDEVYHAFTARRILHDDPKAWEWWNTPPTGFAYEWTHPPLAKLFMTAGMLVIGENSLGWRLPAAIAGVVATYILYRLALYFFKDKVLAILAAAIFSLDGLVLVMSRIGMNDIYFLLFALLCLYLFLKEEYFWAALVYGLSLASKWSALWLGPILFVALIAFRKKIKPSILWFLILVPLVYVGSYIPMFLTGHSFDIFIEVQKQMWWYHTGLNATHAYTSLWWSWPILLRPVYLYTSDVVGGMVARIYAMGNPIIFWGGVLAFVASAYYAFSEKNKTLGFLLFSYLAFFASWAGSPRIMFLYHYLPAIPFMSIFMAYIIRRHPQIIIPFLTLAAVAFIYFYPHYTGIYIPEALDTSYYWFKSWR